MTMQSRTRQQEMKYGQGLAYTWGRKDAPGATRQELTTGDSDFATFFAMYEDIAGHHQTIQDAWKYFSALKMEEQKAYGTEWARLPFSPYEEMNRLVGEALANRERMGTTHG